MKLKVSESFIAGSVSGGVTRIVTAPLDVLKVRLQLQLEPLKVDPWPSNCCVYTTFL